MEQGTDKTSGEKKMREGEEQQRGGMRRDDN